MKEAQRGNDSRLEEMRAKTEELRKRREEEQEAIIAAKRMQQYLASCPNVKQTFSKRAAIDAKRCNVAQMADNEVKRSAEVELDALWHKVMLKELETKKREEAEESRRRAWARQETISTLAKQVADKLALEDEKKRIERSELEDLERLWEDVRQAERRNLEMERRKREELKRELEEQILTTKWFLAERARKEAAVDHAFRTLAEKELAAEKAHARGDVGALRAELLAHLKYLEDLRQEEARRNLEVEAIVRQSHEDTETRRRLALKKFKEAREREMQEVLRGREEQLRTKREAQEEERRLKMEEKEALEKQIEMNANLTAIEQEKIRRRTLRYRLDLEEQRGQVEATKRRELEEDRRRNTEMKKRADEYQRLTDELLNASENITPHPFKVLLQQCAARHTAEREGRSYCPPALTSA